MNLMHVLQKHFLTLSEKQVTAGSVAVQKRLATLLTTIRKENPTAPIYVFGIYNPFYVYFPKMTAMTNSVKAWNKQRKRPCSNLIARIMWISTVCYLMAKQQRIRLPLKEALKEATSGDGNPLIFSQDHFHPNNAGYGQMTKQLMKQMKATKKRGSKKMQAKKRSLQRNAAKQKAVRTGINWWKWLFLILVGLLLEPGSGLRRPH